MSTTVAETKTALRDAPTLEEVGALDVVDAEKMLSSATFPLDAATLIKLTKEYLATSNGVEKPEIVAEDFKFVAPIIGPLGKKEFLKAFASFKLKDAFPDAKGNFYGFSVDPFEPNRVWFMSRFTATHTGRLMQIKPTGKVVESPPQIGSCTWNAEGQCTKLTAGYVMDRQEGNTGGLGGGFGILYAIGSPFPFPECRPYKKSWQFRLFGFVTSLMQKLGEFFAKKEDKTA